MFVCWLNLNNLRVLTGVLSGQVWHAIIFIYRRRLTYYTECNMRLVLALVLLIVVRMGLPVICCAPPAGHIFSDGFLQLYSSSLTLQNT
jgi:hypothetical protein